MRRVYQFWVYMLRCADGSYYVGMTNNLERRLSEHQRGIDLGSYTFKRRPIKLVYSAYFTDVFEAIAWERQLKRWSRKKKEALIREDEDLLHRLAICANETDTMTTIGRLRASTHGLFFRVVPRLRSG